MIAIIIQCYLSIILSVSLGAILLFCVGLYFIFSAWGKPPQKVAQARAREIAKNVIITMPSDLQDLSSIAGDDLFATKLDLARAFIETGNTNSAKAILQGVSKQGNAVQKQEAQRLLQYT